MLEVNSSTYAPRLARIRGQAYELVGFSDKLIATTSPGLCCNMMLLGWGCRGYPDKPRRVLTKLAS